MLGLTRPLIMAALGALASFGAEKVPKKIFSKGYGSKEIVLYKLLRAMTAAQKKDMEQYLVGQGMVGGGAAQYGESLGMLASIGVTLAISLVKKLFGKGLHVKTPPSRTRRSAPAPPPNGKEMQIQRPLPSSLRYPPPFIGSRDDLKK